MWMSVFLPTEVGTLRWQPNVCACTMFQNMLGSLEHGTNLSFAAFRKQESIFVWILCCSWEAKPWVVYFPVLSESHQYYILPH